MRETLTNSIVRSPVTGEALARITKVELTGNKIHVTYEKCAGSAAAGTPDPKGGASSILVPALQSEEE